MAILAAERILGIVPPGTHQFTKFLTPGEVAVMASRAECEMKELAGMVYDPLRNKWSLSSDTQINFIAHCVKETPPLTVIHFQRFNHSISRSIRVTVLQNYYLIR